MKKSAAFFMAATLILIGFLMGKGCSTSQNTAVPVNTKKPSLSQTQGGSQGLLKLLVLGLF